MTAQHYLHSTFDLNDPELVSVFDEIALWSAPFGLKLLETVNYRENITALDIGFGTGFPLLELAMRLGSSGKLYGIDPWKAAAERTRKKIKHYGITNVELIEGLAEDIPLRNHSIDLIVSNNGINNVNDPDKVLSECERIGKPGAQFVATMNLDTTMMEFYNTMEQVLRSRGMDAEIEKMKEHIYHKRKPLTEITRLFEAHRYQIYNVFQSRFEYRFTSGTAMLNYYFIRLAFLDSWKNLVPEASRENIFFEIESRLNEEAAKSGSLTMTVPFAVIDARKLI
jgi:ubiquinone/menaquinone biosynthesis C-methylase UbiE